MFQAIFENLLHFEYLGVFLISFIGSSTIFLPLPAAAFVFLAGGFLNPVVLGISAGLGAGLGELTGYGIGFGGHKIIFKKEVGRRMKKVIDVFKKKGTFYAIILLAATPLPDDILGISAGFLKYDLKKFFLASLIGKIILHLIIAYGGFFGINWIKSIFSKGL